MKYRLEPEFLNRAWCRWMERHHPGRKYFAKNYIHVYRNGQDGIEFETWLWKKGAKVQQENRERFIVFFDEDNLTFFILENM